ncbi:MAG: HdeD family acid-resistance protein [Bauldia sp.]|nr:MAG: HdeD family acid-resistance protein [Bauldia sp.]MBZ0228965.1 HdeD family acid-resistance protein [Bauldia sp.]
MSDIGMMRMNAIDSIRNNWGWFLALGIIFIVGGVFAIFAPGAASLAVTLVVAIVFMWVGIMQIIGAFSDRSGGGFIWQLLIGLIMLIGGLAVYFNPVLGALTLTIVVAAMFIAKGVFQVIMAFQIRPHGSWGWVLVAGILAIVVGLLIWSEWPISGLWALGTLAGISLIFSGWSYVMMAMLARRV